MTKKTRHAELIVPVEQVENQIYFIRGEKVMLDVDLAELYQVETRVLNQAVRRNQERFPVDFMFQLTEVEADNLRSQFVTSSSGYGGRRYRPYAFTELGVAMLSAVLKSQRAVPMSILINARLCQTPGTDLQPPGSGSSDGEVGSQPGSARIGDQHPG